MEQTIANSPESARTREVLIGSILDFMVDQDLLERRDIQSALEREINAAGTDALLMLRDRLAAATDWDYSPPDALARRIHHVLADRFLAKGSEIQGRDNLSRRGDGPLVIVANHLSYADANVIDVLLHQNVGGILADRLTALAGPKVFTSRERRFSSLCFGTIKVPQSAEVASGEAILNTREVARAARRAIDVARERLQLGDALVLFGEGTRSRTAAMQSMLQGTARYLDLPDTWVLPMGLTGSESLFPVEGASIRPSRVVAHIGHPLSAQALLANSHGDKRVVMDAIGLAVARTLPSAYRGVYTNSDQLKQARALLEHTTEASANA